jgi:CheY-like chemotaxis protein
MPAGHREDVGDRDSGLSRRDSAPRVLLVDDSQFDRIAISHLLCDSEAPFQVVPARDADEALAALREQSFDCMLVDVHLPRESGIDLMHRALQQFGKNCPPVVLMTASNNRDTGVHALKVGADDFQNKDTLNAELRQTRILEAIEKRRVEQAQERSELESRMRSLGQLAAGIAHELNNPAAYVRVNLDLLEEQLTAATSGQRETFTRHDLIRQLRLVRECSEGLERMASIVRELQSFTQSSPTHTEPVVVDDVVRSSSR